jgi:peptidoglycan/LPS O-acetylase OafA/YrhL
MYVQKAIADPKRIKSLDFLRGTAITIVFLTHFGLIDFKGIAVDLFFVLSGLLITKSLLRPMSLGLPFSPWEFIIKRSTKILPSYYFFLTFGYLIAEAVVGGISPQDIPTLREMPQYFLFYRNYGGPPPRWTMEHVWSLCAEEHFYLVLLGGVLILQRKRTSFDQNFLLAVLLTIAAGIFFKVQALFTDIAEWPTYTHNRIDAFAWGALLYLLIHSYKALAATLLNNTLLLVSGTTVLTGAVLLDNGPHQLILRTISPFCLSLIILGMYHRKTWFPSLFTIISYYSYSIFLWHFLFVIPIQHRWGDGPIGFTVYLAITTVFAWVTTTLVEENSIRLRRYFLPTLPPTM